MTSYFLWYNSMSHKKTRYFVGSEEVPIEVKTPVGTLQGKAYKPSWTYDKEGMTIFDDNENGSAYQQGIKAKLWCQSCGYKGLVLEPIDELKLPSKEVQEKVH
jgi:hypothetical protein